ncbi:MAG TPA: TetR/AcrR family transcriptional regulator [Syntrophales bacterium]|nr:TetR/AcrR family transcriptional regulator [Syntrophales bacterium]
MMTDKQSLTTARILDAATDIFAEAGFNGARMDEIARRAGVNKAMIYYHIGAKEALYAEVLHGVIGHVADSISACIETGATPEAKLRAYIRGFVDAVEGNPRMGPILLREIASGGQNLPDLVIQDFARIIALITAILDEGRERGVFYPVTPFLIHMTVVGSLILYKTSGPIRSRRENIPAAVKALDQQITPRVTVEVENLILRGIKKPPRPAAEVTNDDDDPR